MIAAASGGLREAVIDGHTGRVLDSRNPAVWAEAVARILSDPAFAERLATAGRKHALHLDWPRSAARLLAVYRGLE